MFESLTAATEVSAPTPAPTLRQEALLESRARALLIASAAVSYPDADQRAALLAVAEAGAAPPQLAPLLAALAGDGDTVGERYIGLFDIGKGKVSLYETEHGRMRGMGKGRDLADIAGFYRAFGLAPATGQAPENLDHLAVELEFYAMLLLKRDLLQTEGDAAGAEIVDLARRGFLHDHLGRFAATVASQPAVTEDALYAGAIGFAAALVASECERLCVEPPPLDFYANLAEGDEMQCGAGVCVPGMPGPGKTDAPA